METQNEYEAPEELTGEALAEWQRVTKELSAKQITGVDLKILQRYCETYAEWKYVLSISREK